MIVSTCTWFYEHLYCTAIYCFTSYDKCTYFKSLWIKDLCLTGNTKNHYILNNIVWLPFNFIFYSNSKHFIFFILKQIFVLLLLLLLCSEMHNLDIPFPIILLPTKLVRLMWPKLPNQLIPFNICHKGLGSHIWAMTFHICYLYTFWDILIK